ncbi:hypothetical protein GDO78_011039 [Eleutherodactylus coqui]|uniref:Uncharacterized protein n=1 Tax=Eleutherodactylus coqui TaxID=57060 RepID=A0A8J6F8C3_ELECQ|nr:hypothetical protein GDO78_011039 [Eleutherodactylus coqui]
MCIYCLITQVSLSSVRLFHMKKHKMFEVEEVVAELYYIVCKEMFGLIPVNGELLLELSDLGSTPALDLRSLGRVEKKRCGVACILYSTL